MCGYRLLLLLLYHEGLLLLSLYHERLLLYEERVLLLLYNGELLLLLLRQERLLPKLLDHNWSVLQRQNRKLRNNHRRRCRAARGTSVADSGSILWLPPLQSLGSRENARTSRVYLLWCLCHQVSPG